MCMDTNKKKYDVGLPVREREDHTMANCFVIVAYDLRYPMTLLTIECNLKCPLCMKITVFIMNALHLQVVTP